MNRLTFLIALPALLGGCMHDTDVKGFTVNQKQLLDARHDHLRCELKLDRLRVLYRLQLDHEPGGLLDSTVVPVSPTGSPSSDAPLTIGHDAPLTGGHDAPLTVGHDDPMSGAHDAPDIDAQRELTIQSKEACWDIVNQLVNRYNDCVVDYKTCVNGGGTACLADYETCLMTK